MQRTESYIIDLTELREEEVSCPGCGTAFSPEDETEDAYTILRTVVKADSLAKITLKCNLNTNLIPKSVQL